MTRKKIISLLALGALAVSIQNLIFFRSPAPTWEEVEDGETVEPSETEAPEPLAAIDPTALSKFLNGVPAPNGERSPFLSRDEADRLRAGVAQRAESGEVREPKLDGILWGPSKRVAWIDGRPLGEGDWVGARRVERIASHDVTLASGDLRLQLKLVAEEPGDSQPLSADTAPNIEVE